MIGLEIAKEIWDTLHLTHEGVSKVKKSKIDLLMAQLNRFVIKDGEGPQEMFDRLMVIVGKIRGLGGDDLNDHHVVKVMLEAFAPRNPTLVTLIREKKRFEEFTPSDVLGRILTHELMEMEIQQRKKFGELEAKMENLKVKEVALKANKSNKAFTSSKPPRSRSRKVETVDSSSDSSDDEDDEVSSGEIGDVALFMRKYKKGLKREGYKFVKRRFPNKQKRKCYNCGSTEHFIANCPYENKEDKKDKKKKHYKKDDKTQHKKKNYSGQAHIGHEWDSNDDSSSEEETKKVATIAIKKHSCSPKLFTNLTDDEERSTLFCLMGKGEKVKPKSKPKPSPPSSDESNIDSSDESSDDEVNNLVSKMDKKSKNFIAKVVDELERTQATLAKQEKLYVTCKKALASERSEVETLRLEIDQAESVIDTLKDDLNTLQEKNNALKTRNEELEEQFSILWDKTSHPTKASEISNASTSKGCDRCYNVDLEACATNLANMEAMKKEIARLNNIIASGCMDDASKKPKFIQERHPFIKDGLGHKKGGKTGERKMVNGVSCIRFEKKETIGEV